MQGMYAASAHEEIERLQAHFRAVLRELALTPLTSLRGGRRIERRRLLRELARYARRGRFPANRALPGLAVPHFVDADGVHCAVGALMRISGAGALVENIAATDNHVRIHELAEETSLADWLDQAGLSLGEAECIQPDYCSIVPAYECLCISALPTAVEARVATLPTDSTEPGSIVVEALHGKTSGLAIGQEIPAWVSNTRVGDRVVATVRIDSEGQPFGGNTYVLEESGHFVCQGLRADGATAASALASADCESILGTVDARWNQSPCDGQGCGCRIGQSGSPQGLEVFLLALAASRLVRARRSSPWWRRRQPSGER